MESDGVHYLLHYVRFGTVTTVPAGAQRGGATPALTGTDNTVKFGANNVQVVVVRRSADGRPADESATRFVFHYNNIVEVQYHYSVHCAAVHLLPSSYLAQCVRTALGIDVGVGVAVHAGGEQTLAPHVHHFDPRADHPCHRGIVISLETPANALAAAKMAQELHNVLGAGADAAHTTNKPFPTYSHVPVQQAYKWLPLGLPPQCDSTIERQLEERRMADMPLNKVVEIIERGQQQRAVRLERVALGAHGWRLLSGQLNRCAPPASHQQQQQQRTPSAQRSLSASSAAASASNGVSTPADRKRPMAATGFWPPVAAVATARHTPTTSKAAKCVAETIDLLDDDDDEHAASTSAAGGMERSTGDVLAVDEQQPSTSNAGNSQPGTCYTSAQAVPKDLVLFRYPPPSAQSANKGAPITSADLDTLMPEEFLNDVIIQFYLHYIHRELVPAERRETIHVFNSFFYSRFTAPLRGKQPLYVADTIFNDQQIRLLAQITAGSRKCSAYQKLDSIFLALANNLKQSMKRYEAVRRWTKNVDVFTKEYIVIPINEESHWFLAIICHANALDPRGNCNGDKKPVILVFDSLTVAPNEHADVAVNLRHWLALEWAQRRCGAGAGAPALPIDGKNVQGLYPEAPQQTNHFDCGVFLLQYAEQFLINPPRDKVNRSMYSEQWFPGESVTEKRATLRELIVRLAKQIGHVTVPLPGAHDKHDDVANCAASGVDGSAVGPSALPSSSPPQRVSNGAGSDTGGNAAPPTA